MIFVDVQGCDPLEEMRIQSMGKVFETLALPWVGPCLPYHPELNHHIGGSEDELGEGDQALEQGSGFGLGTWCHARYGAFSQERSKGEGVDAESKHPCL